MKLLKRLGIPTMALAGMLALFSPSPANARVRFGIGVGVAPYYGYGYAPYCDPYYGCYPYGYTYVAPNWGWGHRWDRDDFGHHFDRGHFERGHFEGGHFRGGHEGHGRR